METAKQFGAFILYLLGCRKKADEIMQRSIKRELESYGWREDYESSNADIN